MFKDTLVNDLNIFINLDEFADNHVIDGVAIPVVVDNDRLKERSKKEYDGISAGEVLFFAKTDALAKKPEPGTPLIFDGRQMYVFDVREDLGILEVILSQNRGG